jgi:nitroreductase
MLNHQTLDQLRALHLDGMVAALQDQATTGVASDMAFEDRLAFLVQRQIGAAEADRLIETMAAVRGLDSAALATYRQMIDVDLINGPRSQQIDRWASNQVYIALGTFMTAAALLEVDTCAIEGFDPLAYDRILNLTDSPYRSCVVCAAGYRDSSDKYASLAKVRYAPAELIERR